MLQFIPCYEGEMDDSPLAPLHPLSGDMDDAAIFRFVQALCLHGDADAACATPGDAIASLAARDGQVLAGGLVVRDGNFLLEPSCCCGLEDWWHWKDMQPGEPSPWLGHDPAPWIEALPDRIILHLEGGQEPDVPRQHDGMLSVSYEAYEAALARAEADLAAFRKRLEHWLYTHAPSATGADVAARIANWFALPKQD
ncbi:MAG: hypothetical protein WA989_15050 [Henriciella sp.]|uniref:hypothetical protein n=1 Tax=Henriciella sp. TaxID=1968823 RepID=UPI003C74638E